MKGIISIFALPNEIDNLHLTLHNLKRNTALLSPETELDIHLTFCVSDELIDWKNSILSKQYFIDKFNSIVSLTDWSVNPDINIEEGNNILGCVSQRRETIKRHGNNYDFTIWLDNDLFFPDITLLYMAAAYGAALDQNTPDCIVTPQLIRQWDDTWDVLVNEHFLFDSFDYHRNADIISDALPDYGEISIKPIDGYKFAGGWFTLISNNILNFTGIPESFGHYGLEDTFVTSVCELSKRHNSTKINPVQYVVNNLIVGEDHRYRNNEHLNKLIASYNKKDDYRNIARANFSPELNKFRRERL